MFQEKFEQSLHTYLNTLQNGIWNKSFDKPYALIAVPNLHFLASKECRNFMLVRIKKAQLAVEKLGLRPTSVIYGNSEQSNTDNMLEALGEHVMALRQSQFVYFCEGWEGDFICQLLLQLARASGRTVLYEKEPDTPKMECGGAIAMAARAPF